MARNWLSKLDAGIDSRAEQRRRRLIARVRSVTLGSCFEEYISKRSLEPGTRRQYERLIDHCFQDPALRPIRPVPQD
ncbi:MAG: hypothetical protein ACYTGM_13085 [Planctomycetota bacterium]|jgi:hypothetical protein